MSPPVENESFRTSALRSVLQKHRHLDAVTFSSIYQKIYSVLYEIIANIFFLICECLFSFEQKTWGCRSFTSVHYFSDRQFETFIAYVCSVFDVFEMTYCKSTVGTTEHNTFLRE
jgi:hypothetical protein